MRLIIDLIRRALVFNAIGTRFFSYKNVYFWSEARRSYSLCLLRLKPCLLCSYFFDRLIYKKAIFPYCVYCEWCQYKMEYSTNKMQDEFQKNQFNIRIEKEKKIQRRKKISIQAMKYKKNQRMFLFSSIEAVMFLFFLSTEARHVLSMFLIFKKFEPQRSYKHGSYSRKSV